MEVDTMKLKNIKGTTKNTCSCYSWLDHWLKFTKEDSLPAFCAEQSCTRDPEVGAHVIKVDSTDEDWYIVPLCKKHNKENEKFVLYSGIKLAPASVSKTCK